MIRILIRQVMDSRHRTPKSLGIADIEPALDLPLFGGQEASDLSVRIYHAPPDDARVRFETRATVVRGAAPDYWEVLWDALKVLPAGQSRR